VAGPAPLDHRVSPGLVGAVVGAAAYAWWTASTRPFTPGADVLTAIPLGAAVVILVLQRTARRPGSGWTPWQRRPALVPSPIARGPLLGLLAAVLGWELWNLFSSPRTTHPTVSSLYDAAAATHAWKALIVLAWLIFGWELLRR
jgi:hypothetical protein